MIKKKLSSLGISSLMTIGACTLYAPHTLAANIVDLQFDENAGLISSDLSGNNNHATLQQAVWVAGKNGSALSFDGVNAYAELANEKTATLYNLHKGNHTITAWVNPAAAAGHRSGVVTRWGVHQGLFYNADGTFTFKHRTPSGTQSVTTPLPYSPGEFYHVATTIDGDTGKLIIYINGEAVATKNYTPEHATQNLFRPWRIGVKDISKATPDKRENFTGIIDEVMFFDIPLSAAEIQERWGQVVEPPTNICTLGPESGSGTSTESTVLEVGDAKSGSFVSFEQAGVPKEWTTDIGILSINNEQTKHGNQSLEWQWSDKAVLEVNDLQGLGLDPTTIDRTNYTQKTFRMWLHNNEAVADDPLRVEFYDDLGNLQYQYYVNLNFTGWRAASVKYRTDMTGDKSSQNLTSMKIIAPENTCSGRLLLDFTDFTADKGVVTGADRQVPMAATGNTNHWTSNLRFESYTQPEQVAATAQELLDAKAMKLAYRQEELASGSADNIADAIAKFDAIGIRIVDGKVLSDQQLFGPYHSAFGIKIGVIDGIILTLARDYIDNNNTDSLDRITLLVKYMLEQGFAAGSLMENSSHIGYSTRNISNAILLLETELKAAGLWQEAYEALAWYNTMEQIWQPAVENLSNSDHARTRIPAILGVILHMEDEEKRVHYLKGYKAHIETWLTAYARGNNGVKPDYSSFHHNTHYPGYVYGALGSMSKAVRYLSKSQFSISDEKFTLIERMALSYAVHHAGRDLPLSLAGRNPFKYPSVSTVLQQLGKASTTPEQKAKFFGAYNRLYLANDTTAAYQAEENPEGFWQFNYRPMGVYREDNWVANIKGISKYFWGTEIYTKDNRFGRYQSYGSIFINYQPDDENKGDTNYDGVTEAGWDWNKTPGATTKHLSWDDLVAKKSRQDEWSDGTFSGALRFDDKDEDEYYVDSSVEGECGVHGLNFKQRGSLSPTHEDTFTFKQSVFACDGMIIALGSNINSTDGQNPIATNLFQTSTVDATQLLVENNATRPQSEYSKTLSSGNNWLIDTNGTGYFVFEGDQIQVKIGNQSSPYHRENGVSFTEGSFASAWIEHGLAPEDASYHYVIMPNASHSQMNEFAKDVKVNGKDKHSDDSPYQIVQQNGDAHIISLDDDELEAYVIFNANTNLTGNAIMSSDTPILAAAELDDDELELSLVNPDHNFTGKMPRWVNGQPMQVTITLNGKWQLESPNASVNSVVINGETTIVTVTTENAQPYDMEFEKVE